MSTLNLPYSMVADRDAGIKANAQHVDDDFNAVKTAVDGKLDLDGSSVPTADIPMGSHKITGVATPTASGDAANKGYVDSQVSTLSGNCVKLSGNQTIAGTKTFSSTISGSINGNAATVTNGVYTTGNQTIAGTKTFSSTIQGNISGSSGSCTGNAATATSATSATKATQDGNGNNIVSTYAPKASPALTGTPTAPTQSTSDNSTRIATTAFVKNQAYAADNAVVKLTGNQTIGGTKTFSAAAFGKASDADNSLLTTTKISKAQSGYVKLGNGLIIQWGTTGTDPVTTIQEITFPVPFSSATSYVVTGNNYQTSNNSGGYDGGIGNFTATGFKYYGPTYSTSPVNNVVWIAIGY